MSFQEFERKYSYLLSWEDAEKKVGRRLDWNNNFDCCLYHDLLVAVKGKCKEKRIERKAKAWQEKLELTKRSVSVPFADMNGTLSLEMLN